MARRAAIEAKYPAAKGFVAAADLQAKLKADKTLEDKKAAVTAFDRLARGKWVLFTGPLVNLKDDAFDIALEYTPQLPNDPMGMSRQFFEVSMSKVEGYEKEAFKGGNVGVVLVKYNGATKGEPGYELVATGVDFRTRLASLRRTEGRRALQSLSAGWSLARSVAGSQLSTPGPPCTGSRVARASLLET